LDTVDIKEFSDQSPEIQALIARGLALTKLNLKYQYGSDDPKNGGMDCSGTVHYLLEQSGIKDVPRDATGLYTWAWKEGHVQPVVSSNLTTFELSRLKPGDLLFWIGTYDVDRDPPISHVMIYLGTNRLTGKPVMVGASEGRTYKGKSQYGVSVFDFVLPKASSKVGAREYQGRFIGYGPIPGLR
jgi:cell wall-associated NlpC family hydrolase